jgi:hypothetical protein
MQAPVYNLAGEVVANIEISDNVFGVAFNESLVHQSVLRQQANARQGNASTAMSPEAPVNSTSKRVLVPRVPVAVNRHCAGAVVLSLVLIPGIIIRQCLRVCVGWL